MLSNLEESPITQLLQVLWRGRSVLGSSSVAEEIAIGMSVPYTVVYEHNFPKGLFYSGTDGNLQRRVGKEIDSKTVFSVFSDIPAPSSSGDGVGAAPSSPSATGGKRRHRKAASPQRGGAPTAAGQVPGVPSRDPTGVSDIVAVYTEKRYTEDRSNTYSSQYFTDAGLRAFLLGSSSGNSGPAVLGTTREQGNTVTSGTDFVDLHTVPSKNGILQKFVYPIGSHSEIIQVLWTPHLCIAEKLRSCMLLGDTSKTPFQRAATIEAPANFCTRAYVSPQAIAAIRAQCERLVEQLYVVERRLVQQMTLYFKVDEREHLWFLWSPSIQFVSHRHNSHSNSDSTGIGDSGKRGAGGGGGGPSSPTSSGEAHKSAAAAQHRILNMTPKFLLPKSCGGDFASRAALYLSRNDTTLRPDKPIKGASDKEGKGTFRVTNNVSFDHGLTEEAVLTRRMPGLEQRCLSDAVEGAVFVRPTKSRLCPKMKWLEGRKLTAEFFRKSQLDPLPPPHATQGLVGSMVPSEGSGSGGGIAGPTGKCNTGNPNDVTANNSNSNALSSQVGRATKVDAAVGSLLSIASPAASRAASPSPPAGLSSHHRRSGGNAAAATSSSSPARDPPKYSMNDLRHLAAETSTLMLPSQKHAGGGGASPPAKRAIIDILRSSAESDEAALRQRRQDVVRQILSNPVSSASSSLLPHTFHNLSSPTSSYLAPALHAGPPESAAAAAAASSSSVLAMRQSPHRVRAAEGLATTRSEGDLTLEMQMLRSMCCEPIPAGCASNPAAVDELLSVKASMEMAAEFLIDLREACTTHFTLFPTMPSVGVTCPPFAFSVPTIWVEHSAVRAALLALFRPALPEIDMVTAVLTDFGSGRRGWSDDCSYHHVLVQEQNLLAARLSQNSSRTSSRPATGAAGGGNRAARVQSSSSGNGDTSSSQRPPSTNSAFHEKRDAATVPQSDAHSLTDVNSPSSLGATVAPTSATTDEDVPVENTVKDAKNDPAEGDCPDATNAGALETPATTTTGAIVTTPQLPPPGATPPAAAATSSLSSPPSRPNSAAGEFDPAADAAPALTNVAIPCFVMNDFGCVTRFLSKISPFLVVTLRTLHDDVQVRWLTSAHDSK